jgi:protein-S-isoprenylcysteine O-methyltransferase Ste14
MYETLERLTILGILIFWPLIPLFWIPVHLCTGFFKRLGILTYPLAFILWGAVTWLTLSFKDLLLQALVPLPLAMRGVGWLLFLLGLALQAWTIWLLRARIIGSGELGMERAELETRQPFSLCRHPTYLAHMLIFWGGAMATGSLALFVVAAADMLLTLFIIIPMEERELEARFGERYRRYAQRVPRLIPEVFKRKKFS